MCLTFQTKTCKALTGPLTQILTSMYMSTLDKSVSTLLVRSPSHQLKGFLIWRHKYSYPLYIRFYEILCIVRFIYLFIYLVGTATGYGLDDRGVGVRVLIGWRVFASPYRPDRPWGPPRLLSNGYRGSFPGVKAAGE
jgi:hypothetical protein